MTNQPKKNVPGNREQEKAATAARREARREKAAVQAARLKAEQASRKRKDRLIVGGVVAVVLALIAAAVWFQLSRSSGPVEAPNNATGYGFTVGEDDAANDVEIVADYMCPACADFEEATEAPLAAAVEAGTAKVTYLPVEFLGDYSEQAANAVAVVLDTAGPEVALEFNRNLFAEQPDRSTQMPDSQWLIDLAVKSGATESEVREGIENNEFKRWVQEGTQDAQRRGVTGTPTVFINGDVVELNEALAQIEAL